MTDGGVTRLGIVISARASSLWTQGLTTTVDWPNSRCLLMTSGKRDCFITFPLSHNRPILLPFRPITSLDIALGDMIGVPYALPNTWEDRLMLTPPIRKEVLDFVKASETILSSVLIKPALTQDERALISEYIRYLSDYERAWNNTELEKTA